MIMAIEIGPTLSQLGWAITAAIFVMGILKIIVSSR